jgi:CubicO group peptidase (beta-lactamase class C family)
MRKIPLRLVLALTPLSVLPLALTQAAQPAPGDMKSLSAKVDQLFAKWDKTDSPGAAVAILKDGKTLHQRGYGMANLEWGLSISTATVFLIASLSKHFTVFCILLLAQGGTLSLDDDVRQHVPEVPNFGKTITVRHLIHHTSGLREYLPLATYAGWRSGDALTERDLLDLVSKQKELNFEPGSQYLYCNTGYELLGLIVKRASGKSLRDFAHEKVFEPLGMKNTQFRDDYRMLVKNWAASYTLRPGGGYQYGLVHHGLAGASNVHTTVEDLALWDRNFYDARVGGKQLLDKMHQTYKLTGGKEIDYAGGLHVSKYRGLKTVEHTGSHGGFRTVLLRFPDQKFSVILLANVSDLNTAPMARKIADLYLEGEFKKDKAGKLAGAAPVDPKVVERYLGDYYFEAGLLMTITRKGDNLVVQSPLGPKQLLSLSDTVYVDKDGEWRFEFTHADIASPHVRVSGGPVQLEGRRIERELPPADKLKECVGDFYSDELEVLYHVVLRDGKLWLRHRKGEFALRPWLAGQFFGDFGDYGGMVTLRFAYNSDKRVNGFTLSSGRVKNLRFARAEIKTVPTAVGQPPQKTRPGHSYRGNLSRRLGANRDGHSGQPGGPANRRGRGGVHIVVQCYDGRSVSFYVNPR